MNLSGINLLVCGGQDYQNRSFVFETLDQLHKTWKFTSVVHGACGWDGGAEKSSWTPETLRGADRWADEWVEEYNRFLFDAYGRQVRQSIGLTRYPANWTLYKKSAGRRRNIQMSYHDIHCGVAFPGNSGTRHMVSILEKKNIPLKVV